MTRRRRRLRIIATAAALTATVTVAAPPLAHATPQPAPDGPTLTIIEPNGERTVLKAETPPGMDPKIAAAASEWQCELYDLRLPHIVNHPLTPNNSEVAVSGQWKCTGSGTGRIEATIGVESRSILGGVGPWQRRVTRDWKGAMPGILGLGATTENAICLEIQQTAEWRGVANPRLILDGWAPFNFGWHYSPAHRPTGECRDDLGI